MLKMAKAVEIPKKYACKKLWIKIKNRGSYSHKSHSRFFSYLIHNLYRSHTQPSVHKIYC